VSDRACMARRIFEWNAIIVCFLFFYACVRSGGSWRLAAGRRSFNRSRETRARGARATRGLSRASSHYTARDRVVVVVVVVVGVDERTNDSIRFSVEVTRERREERRRSTPTDEA